MAELLLMCSLLQLVLIISCVSANTGVVADDGADASAGATGQVQTPVVALHAGSGCMKLNARAHTLLLVLLLHATCKTFDSEHCMRWLAFDKGHHRNASAQITLHHA